MRLLHSRLSSNSSNLRNKPRGTFRQRILAANAPLKLAAVALLLAAPSALALNHNNQTHNSSQNHEPTPAAQIVTPSSVANESPGAATTTEISSNQSDNTSTSTSVNAVINNGQASVTVNGQSVPTPGKTTITNGSGNNSSRTDINVENNSSATSSNNSFTQIEIDHHSSTSSSNANNNDYRRENAAR